MSVIQSSLEEQIAQAAARVIDAAYPQPGHRKMPATLWHYTSNATLLKILESRSVWATHVSCVNDSSEAAHLFDLISQRLQSRLTKPSAAPIINHIKEARGKDYCTTSHWFISSYCTDGDDLNLWRAYTQGEGGVAIGFDSKKLRCQAIQNGAGVSTAQSSPYIYLLPVIYAPKKQKTLVSDLLDQIETLFCTHSVQQQIPNYHDYWNLWENQIAILAPLVKHQAFKTEKEWRLITQLGGRPSSDLKFLTRHTTITRHLPLTLATAAGSSGLPITEIKIGPSRHQDITKASVDMLLASSGYQGVNVECSRIPFRSL